MQSPVTGRRGVLVVVLVGVLLAGLVGVVSATLPPGGTFSDDDGNVHEGAIEAIAAEGITRGCNPPVNDRYCPSSPVTRGQMAAFLVRALGLTERLDDPFSDDDGCIFEADIEKLAAAGLTRGCNRSAFLPPLLGGRKRLLINLFTNGLFAYNADSTRFPMPDAEGVSDGDFPPPTGTYSALDNDVPGVLHLGQLGRGDHRPGDQPGVYRLGDCVAGGSAGHRGDRLAAVRWLDC